jgi:hypothetical protein
MEDKEKIHYKPYCYRLNPKTVERINKLKKTEGVSFNKLFMKLLDSYEQNNPRRLSGSDENNG